MRLEAFSTASDGVEIHGIVHLPTHLPAPRVICSHGLFSSKDSSKFAAMARDLAEGGMVAVRYGRRGCGDSRGHIEDTTGALPVSQ